MPRSGREDRLETLTGALTAVRTLWQRPEPQVRHYTESLGCVAATPASPPYVDPCYANFRSLGGLGQQYCDDPYFGGQAKCCYDIAVGNCSSCE